eukprot:Skav203423  [mRNA]  locus=scaffold1743:394523:400823:- [translate_table: standard]
MTSLHSRYPGDPGNPGGDCAGTVCSVFGEKEVAQLRPGHDVFGTLAWRGIAWGCLQTYACTEALLLAPKPSQWSFEQMAAWSVTFATTEEAFQELAPLKCPGCRVRKGERVLIHAATGGVGLVAVQFAQRVGATIFATAGSPGKVQHLRDMGVKYITSSRDAKVGLADRAGLVERGYEGLSSGIDAMRYLQRAQQIGKVVLTQPSRMQLVNDGRYVLSGGVGALGLVTWPEDVPMAGVDQR